MRKWRSIFQYQPIDYRANPQKIEAETQRIFLWNSIGGNEYRILFSNKYGNSPLVFDRVTVGTAEEPEGRTKNITDVTANGQEQITIDPGREFYSDPIQLSSEKESWFVISTWFGCQAGITSACTTYSRAVIEVKNGSGMDASHKELFLVKPQRDYISIVKSDSKNQYFYGIRGVETFASENCKTLAVFGDSITHQGFWAGELIKMLNKKYPGQWSMMNCGIGGNRILYSTAPSEGIFEFYGKAGVSRFADDVFGRGPVDTVIVLHGINDLLHPGNFAPSDETATAQEMISGLIQYAKEAHKRNVPIYAGTILPVGNAEWITDELEKIRQSVNTWIRENKEYDGYIDFEEAVKDNTIPPVLKKEYDSGDHLHPTQAGGKAMAKEAMNALEYE